MKDLSRLKLWFPDLCTDLFAKLEMFHVELLKFNPKINLISRNTVEEADLLHFADSLLGAKYCLVGKDIESVYDIGSGNGFPGLISALLYPNISFTLVEIDKRKCEFIKHVAFKLKIENLQVLNIRFEQLESHNIEFAMARAFAPIARASKWAETSMQVGAEFYHLKSEAWKEEVLEEKDWKHKVQKEYMLPDSDYYRAIIRSKRIK